MNYSSSHRGKPQPGDNREPARQLSTQIKFEPLEAELFDRIAQQMAEIIAECRSETNKSTQVRKFYDELTMWNDRVQSAGDPQAKYRELAPFIKMLNAKVTYARGRKHVDEAFETLFSHCIRQINSAQTLHYCKLFIEAFIGFYKVHKK